MRGMKGRDWNALRGARDVAYWAQQLAWSPVVPHALSWWLRLNSISEEERAGLIEAVKLGLEGLGLLPERPPIRCTALATVAERQARALSSGICRRLPRSAFPLRPFNDSRYAIPTQLPVYCSPPGKYSCRVRNRFVWRLRCSKTSAR